VDDDKKHGEETALIRRAKEIFREHGWPDLDKFRKHKCMEAVTAATKSFRAVLVSGIPNHNRQPR
jgi:hypothetical protein